MLETPEVVINPGSIQAEVECNKDLEITLQKREFSIVGDNVYVTSSSEAPQWLLDLINGTIANAIAEGTADFDDLRENILNAIAAMNIAKNDYDSYVIKLEDAEGRLLAYTETLNATVADSVAQIVSTLVTKVTADEALTIAVDAIQSSINGGAIKAQIDTINTTLATESLSRATQVDTIMAAITDESSGLAANATAIEILDATVTANQTASATWQTNLETFLETGDTTGTTIDSQSNVYSILRSDITSAESKFEYNSNLIINGHPYSSGFGLVSNLTVNSNDEPIAPNLAEGDSEFWIKADRFKLTAVNGLVSNYVPFEVDGTTGDIKFNGKVTFSSISDASSTIPTIESVNSVASAAVTNNNDVLAQQLGYTDYNAMVAAATNGTTLINGGYINTNLIQANAITANKINTTGLIADNISGLNIYGKTITGGKIEGATITGAVIKTSWLDLTSTGYLTDWKYFSPGSPPPSQYLANFAKNATTGSLIIDSEGYYRLPKTKTAVYSGQALSYVKYSYGTLYIPNYNFDVISYDDYTIASENRVLRVRPRFAIQAGAGEHLILKATHTFDRHHNYVTMQVGSNTLRLTCDAEGYFNRFTLTYNGSTIINTQYDTIDYTITIMGLQFRIKYRTLLAIGEAISGYVDRYLDGYEVYLLTFNDPSTGQNGLIEFNENFTTSSILMFKDMQISSGHDNEVSKLNIYPPTFIEVYSN